MKQPFWLSIKSTALQEIHAFLAAMGTMYPPMKRPAVLILQQKCCKIKSLSSVEVNSTCGLKVCDALNFGNDIFVNCNFFLIFRFFDKLRGCIKLILKQPFCFKNYKYFLKMSTLSSFSQGTLISDLPKWP